MKSTSPASPPGSASPPAGGQARQHWISLPLWHRQGPGTGPRGSYTRRQYEDGTRFMLALAAALEQHPGPRVTGQAAADLRRLAAADPADIRQWLRERR